MEYIFSLERKELSQFRKEVSSMCTCIMRCVITSYWIAITLRISFIHVCKRGCKLVKQNIFSLATLHPNFFSFVVSVFALLVIRRYGVHTNIYMDILILRV